MLDLGRHVLAKGFGEPVVEYKEIASILAKKSVLNEGDAKLLRELAGSRNRMVHFYQRVSEKELYDICTRDINDIEAILNVIIQWARDHPEMIDQAI